MDEIIMLTDCVKLEDLQYFPQGQQTYFFPLNYVLFIWQEHMPTASPQIFLIYYYETETKTILSITKGNPASRNNLKSNKNITDAGSTE